MNERIKKVRKANGLTQQEFANRLNIGRGTLANYEVGRNEPIDAVVSLICREFNVNKNWLCTGEGEMLVESSSGALDILALEYHLDRFERIAVEKFLNLKPETRNVLLDYVKQIAAEIANEKANDDPTKL